MNNYYYFVYVFQLVCALYFKQRMRQYIRLGVGVCDEQRTQSEPGAFQLLLFLCAALIFCRNITHINNYNNNNV